MRVLIAAAGSHGDVLPFVALGKALARRGHEVRVHANPVFAELVADAGLRVRPVGSAQRHGALFAEVGAAAPRQAFERIAREFDGLTGAYLASMKAEVVPGRTVAIGGSMLFAPRLLAETHAIPCVTVHLAPSIVRSDLQPARLAARWISGTTPALVRRLAWWLSDRYYDRSVNAPLNLRRAELGLPPVQRIFRSWVHEADRVICMFPAWFAAPQDDWPRALVQTGFPLYDDGDARPLSAELSHFLDAGPPPVAFSPGTANASAHDFFRTSIDACEAAGLRAILLSPFAEHVPASLPSGIVHARYAPFGALLPRLAALVHHGGIGTIAQALRAGVPQLIRPTAFDQFDNSARTVALGVAHELLPARYDARRVAQSLQSLTGDAALRERCATVARQFDGVDGVALAGDAVESLWNGREGAAQRPG